MFPLRRYTRSNYIHNFSSTVRKTSHSYTNSAKTSRGNMHAVWYVTLVDTFRSQNYNLRWQSQNRQLTIWLQYDVLVLMFILLEVLKYKLYVLCFQWFLSLLSNVITDCGYFSLRMLQLFSDEFTSKIHCNSGLFNIGRDVYHAYIKIQSNSRMALCRLISFWLFVSELTRYARMSSFNCSKCKLPILQLLKREQP